MFRGEFFQLFKLSNYNFKTSILYLINKVMPQRLGSYLFKEANVHTVPYWRLFIFCLANYSVLHYLLKDKISGSVSLFLLIAEAIGLLFCCLLSTYGRWSNWLKAYFKVFWYVTVGYCLPFISSLMLFISLFVSHGDVALFTSTVATILVVFILLDFYAGTIVIFCFSLLGYFVSKLLLQSGDVGLSLAFLSTKVVIYGVVLAFLIGFLFLSFKTKNDVALDFESKSNVIYDEKVMQDFLDIARKEVGLVNAFNKLFVKDIRGLVRSSGDLLDGITSGKSLDLVAEEAKALNKRSQSVLAYFGNHGYGSFAYMHWEVVEIAMGKFVKDFEKKLARHYMESNVYIHNFLKHKTIVCDVNKLYALMLNSISFIKAFTRANGQFNNIITICITNARVGYYADASNSTVTEVEGVKICVILNERFLSKDENIYIANGEGDELDSVVDVAEFLPLAANNRIIQLYRGYSRCIIDQSCNVEQVYVIPCDISAVIDAGNQRVVAVKDHADVSHEDLEMYDRLESNLCARIGSVSTENVKINLETVRKAMEMVKKNHCGQLYKNGAPLYYHLVETANIVLGYSADEDTVLVALLHHILGCSNISLDHINELFGEGVADMVREVNSLNGKGFNRFKIKKYAYYNNLGGLLNQMDKKVLHVKLADRLHSLRSLDGSSMVTKKKTAEEVLLYFVPVAKSLGLHPVVDELSSTCCSILND
jgi:hypothetical protein